MSHFENVSDRSTGGPRPLWQRIVCRWADALGAGSLTLVFPDGSCHRSNGSAKGPDASLRFASRRGFMQILLGGSMGFARAYLDGHVDTPDLHALLKLALANEDRWGKVLQTSRLISKLDFFRHRLRKNSRAGSRRNIAFHYDLGNAFYRQWLDDTMTYSSAIFSDASQSLEDAQTAKYDRILERLDIGPNDRILEIGCGWGGFAEHAIRSTGCHVTGLTLSVEQARYARARLCEAGFSERSEVRLQDYRECRGNFTKIVSIEMFEAVGEENWPVYFSRVRSLLVPEGQALIQVITIDEERFRTYRRKADFIQKYIFPGGMLPSATAFASAARDAGLATMAGHSIGQHYARTLLEWEKRFRAAWAEIARLGFDERFRRMWLYYLAYCRVGFLNRRIDVIQFELKPQAAGG
ncbi:cyclopropane-fatty-acyl-phospholipid synthase family protein [Nitratireductor sp. GISD-1A_MAKvit]|uniref:class I SAM-dependent methyltransferase n=1 Tax=Nitratireductor sp. GISD-1A_MAKvit TaxID=3234198 RepID=UPI00346520F5